METPISQMGLLAPVDRWGIFDAGAQQLMSLEKKGRILLTPILSHRKFDPSYYSQIYLTSCQVGKALDTPAACTGVAWDFDTDSARGERTELSQFRRHSCLAR